MAFSSKSMAAATRRSASDPPPARDSEGTAAAPRAPASARRADPESLRRAEQTRRAMNKSFVESGGTVLSTNWTDVGAKTVEGTPPKGLEMKKWSDLGKSRRARARRSANLTSAAILTSAPGCGPCQYWTRRRRRSWRANRQGRVAARASVRWRRDGSQTWSPCRSGAFGHLIAPPPCIQTRQPQEPQGSRVGRRERLGRCTSSSRLSCGPDVRPRARNVFVPRLPACALYLPVNSLRRHPRPAGALRDRECRLEYLRPSVQPGDPSRPHDRHNLQQASHAT
jgi:hypothetical protein